jgi:LPXTG-site transpeptidase (sortase) family protein
VTELLGRLRSRRAALVAGAVVAVLAATGVAVGLWLRVPRGPANVHAEIADQDLFGKVIATARPSPAASIAAHPVTSPIEPARLQIPSLALDARVERLGVTKQGSMDVPSNVWDVGWLETGIRPGGRGNAVIDGHRDSASGPAIFMRLDRVKVGDTVLVSDAGGRQLTFVVDGMDHYGVQRPPLDAVFGPSDERRLNLITCAGSYDRNQHDYTERLVVHAKLT